MKIRWRYGIAFPLILAVALGGLSAWLGRISEVEIEEVRLNPDEPQYTMDGLDGRRFDEQGYLKEHLSAKGAKQFPESSDIHFDSPHLVFFQEGRLLYEVGSDEAVYHTENKQVLFKNNVVLTKTADGKRQAGKVEAEKLHVDTESQYAQTDTPVSFQYGAWHGQAGGMTYDHKTGMLNFSSKVKATIYDTKDM
ncbi:TPA: LPS export ABC transporter periplasmic protein LptC [Neisseria meningitidis]